VPGNIPVLIRRQSLPSPRRKDTIGKQSKTKFGKLIKGIIGLTAMPTAQLYILIIIYI